MKRVDIRKILKDPEKRRKMVAGSIRFIQAIEGRDLTVEESLAVYDRMTSSHD